ncbi:lysophospholipid acyltransferase family protein [Portibacter marinus]|uniref:lysophospholipid acyltransferase family protein n=1 Tax=Portibacter marinus TaxID=2898660 RepID=UPI001F3A9EA0|nr:lysophospholipid acyltransferase family protein [Portibacter marinus]
MKPLKSLRAIFRLLALGFTLMLFVFYYRIRCLFKKHTIERGFRLRRAWVNLAFKILNLHIVEQKGEIPDFPCLYIINHRNLIDPVIIAYITDTYFLAKAEIESYPFLGRGAAMTGVIYVDRDEKNSRVAARKKLFETMSKNLNLAVYPEGTTGTEETTINFHKGSFDEAAKLKYPVVPIAQEFKNKSDLWIQPSLLKQFMIQFGKKRTEVKVEIHPALISDNPTFLMRESRRLIDESLKEMHVNWHQVWGRETMPSSKL